MNISYAYLETTNYCNLKCINCNREDVIGSLKHMSLSEFQHIMEQLKDQPITVAKLMGMGEPFMHPGFANITKMFKQYFPNSYVISATNGQYRITNSMIEALRNIDECYISIDGAERNYERIRAGASWKKLHDFLNQLTEIYNEVDCKFPVNFTVTPDVVDDIPIIESLVEEYGLDELRLNIVQSWDQAVDIGYSIFTDEQIETLQKYKHLVKGKAVWDFDQCFWPNNGIYITVEGNMKVCCMNTSADSIGNVMTQPIQMLRASPKFKAIQNGCASNTPTEHCRTCSYKSLVPMLSKIMK